MAADGTTVYAAGDGVVATVRWQDANIHRGAGAGAGYYVTIDHGNGEVTKYFHLSDPAIGPAGPITALPGCTNLGVCAGMNVLGGQAISSSDSTGNITGPHLHFEVHKNGTAVDPEKVLKGALTAKIAMAIDYEIQAGTQQEISLAPGLTPEAAYVTVVELTTAVEPGEHRLQFVVVESSGTFEVLAEVPLTVNAPFTGLVGTDLEFTDLYFEDPTHVDDYTQHEIGRLESRFSLVAVDATRLQGQAHITYNRIIEQADPTAFCGYSTDTYGPVEWDAFLEGTYGFNPDGSIYVDFQATPGFGPDITFSRVYEGAECARFNQSSTVGSRSWTGFSGTLVNGVYDLRQDAPPSDYTGEEYREIHVKWTENP